MASQGLIEMLGATRVGSNKGKVYGGLGGRRQFALRAFRYFFQTLQCQPILAQINTGIFSELVRHPVHDSLVEIFAAKKSVAGSGEHFENAFIHFEDRYVKRPAAKIVNRDALSSRFS